MRKTQRDSFLFVLTWSILSDNLLERPIKVSLDLLRDNCSLKIRLRSDPQRQRKIPTIDIDGLRADSGFPIYDL